MQNENVLPYVVVKRPIPEKGYPATGNMRKREAWMVKGTRVVLSTGTGTISHVIGCVKGGHGTGYCGEDMVLKIYVQPENVANAWPMNPHNVEPAQQLKRAI